MAAGPVRSLWRLLLELLKPLNPTPGRGADTEIARCGQDGVPPQVTAPLYFLLSSLELSDTSIYEPEIRGLLETAPNSAKRLFLNRELPPTTLIIHPSSLIPTP